MDLKIARIVSHGRASRKLAVRPPEHPTLTITFLKLRTTAPARKSIIGLPLRTELLLAGFSLPFQQPEVKFFVDRATWENSATAAGQGCIWSLFRLCVKLKWIVESPASADLRSPNGASKLTHEMPFTDDPLKTILSACDRMPEIRWKNGVRGGMWTAKT